MKNKLITGALVLLFSSFFISCGDDDGSTPPFTRINISVRSAADSSVVTGANVILYNASNGNAVKRVSSGNDGNVLFDYVDAGTFYVKITAQNFSELPPENITPVPFSASQGQTTGITYLLNPMPGQFGKISGNVNPSIAGMLVKAVDNSSSSYSTYTGPDGYYVLFNLPYQTYTLGAFKQGYRNSSEPQVTLSSGSSSSVQDISVIALTGSSISGSVTFLAVNNGIVDVTLLDRNTNSAINGLSTVIDSSRLYRINGIPKGEYLAWASFKNDGYVMDPDWIFKNPGGLNVSFPTDTSTKTLNFSVTGAISILSPTNPRDTIIPVTVDTTAPLFSWTAYPQAKEYIIEVRDINGNLIWGGYDADGNIRHAVIPKETTNVRFNFDNSASAQLVKGQIYQWKIYADDSANPNIQTLLSSSENLMGLFKIK